MLFNKNLFNGLTSNEVLEENKKFVKHHIKYTHGKPKIALDLLFEML
jgi:hypothetical protein